MKLIIGTTLLLVSFTALADRGPYFPSLDQSPVSYGKVVFHSPDLNQVSQEVYVGQVVVAKNIGGFEVAPMIYKCIFNEDDGAYGSLSCKYLRYDMKKAVQYKSCDFYDNTDFNCY